MKKVLIVGPEWFGNNIEYLSGAFRRHGFDVCTYCYSKSKYLENSHHLKSKFKTVVKRHISNSIISSLSQLSFARRDKLLSLASNEDLIEATRDCEPNLVFINKGEYIRPTTIAKIKQMGCKVFFWWFDNPFEYFKVHKDLIYSFYESDHVFLFDQYYVDRLKEVGSFSCSLLPNGYDDHLFFPNKNGEMRDKPYDLSFVGSYYPAREASVNELSPNKIFLWGVEWRSQKLLSHVVYNEGYVYPEKLKEIYQSTKINLNFHQTNLVFSGNQRVFEISALGEFQLVPYNKGIASEFIEGEDIIFYRDFYDLKKKIKLYLNNESLRQVIQNNARNVSSQYSFYNRLKTITQLL